MKAQVTIQQILQSAYAAFERSHRLPAHVRRAVEMLIACRTAALGGHIQACPEGHVERVWYNSCRHRMCPQCAFIQVERWLAQQKARLLACDYYHVIFTLPSELHGLWLANVRLLTNLLFASVGATLTELLADEKYLGAKAGVIAALHTWGQTLVLHPHIHSLVTGGGLTEGGQWKTTRKKGFLLPSRVGMEVFRGKLLEGIRRVAVQGKLELPEGMRLQQVYNLLNQLGRKKWHVHIQGRYAHGEGVVTYLARYLRGGPISNRRLIALEGEEVRFRYTNNRERDEEGGGKPEILRLKVEEFLQRLLLHVPEPGTQVVRCYGVYGSGQRKQLESCREQLGQGRVAEVEEMDWQQYCSQRGEEHPERCPVCGRRMVGVVSWPRGGAPPRKEERRKKAA